MPLSQATESSFGQKIVIKKETSTSYDSQSHEIIKIYMV